MIPAMEIENQEKLVEAYREEFNQYRSLMEASRQRVLRAKAKLQNMKAKNYFTSEGQTPIELNA